MFLIKKFTKLLGLGIVLGILLGGLWYFGLSKIEQRSHGHSSLTEENSLKPLSNCCSQFGKKPEIALTNLISQPQLETLEKDILDVLGEDKDKYSVVVLDVESGKIIEINSDIERLPGSISKVPYAILLLEEVENGNLDLESTLQLQSWHKAYSTDELWYRENGSEVTVKDLLEFLIVESDNTAMTLIEDYFGGVDEFNQKINEIGITGVTRYPHITTAGDVAKMMEGIEAGSFLDAQQNQYLINLMGRTNSKYHDRIVAGLPNQTKYAHKIGQLFDESTEAYNDAAIVFGEKSDYVLVILTQNVEAIEASQKSEEISRLVYQVLNN